MPLAQKALALLEQSHDARNLARLRAQLGLVQLEMEPPEVDEAIVNLSRAQEEMSWSDASVGDRARLQLALGKARLLIGDAEEAERLAEDCLSAEEGASLVIAAEARTLLGQAAAARGLDHVAVEHFRRAIMTLSGVGADREAAQLWFELGSLMRENGAVEEALEAFRRAGASTGLTQPTMPSRRAVFASS